MSSAVATVTDCVVVVRASAPRVAVTTSVSDTPPTSSVTSRVIGSSAPGRSITWSAKPRRRTCRLEPRRAGTVNSKRPSAPETVDAVVTAATIDSTLAPATTPPEASLTTPVTFVVGCAASGAATSDEQRCQPERETGTREGERSGTSGCTSHDVCLLEQAVDRRRRAGACARCTAFCSPQKVDRRMLGQVSWLGGGSVAAGRFTFPGRSAEWRVQSDVPSLTVAGPRRFCTGLPC